MQKKCARYLHISSDKVMKITESLYEKGYISYPRTETDMFVEGFDIQSLLKEQVDHPKWGNYISFYFLNFFLICFKLKII